MPFNPNVKKKIVRDKKNPNEYLPCVMCGTKYPLPDAIHIIDEKEWVEKVGSDKQVNGIPLCPNCHRIFDEILRPKLFEALTEFGSLKLPKTWKGNNKITVTDQTFG
jgi:predicted restriction endonuclease